jgi:hypothetical protein
MAGRTTAAGNYDSLLVVTDSDGNKIGDISYGGPETDDIYDVIETFDGSYVMTGWTQCFGDDTVSGNLWIVKFSPIPWWKKMESYGILGVGIAIAITFGLTITWVLKKKTSGPNP